MAPVTEEPITEVIKRRGEQRDQKAVDEGEDEHHLFASFPILDADAFNGQFRFVEADGCFNLPTAIVGQDDTPGDVNRSNGL